MLSDLSVFHRIEDPGELTIRRFRSLVTRLPAYAGALRVALGTQTAEVASAAGTPVRTAFSPPAGGSGGDTPPDVLAAMKRQQFAQRHGGDPSAIEWDNAKIFKELVYG